MGTCASFEEGKHGLANQNKGWKWARNINKNPKKCLHMKKMFAGKKKKGPKVKFGIRSVHEAYRLDKINGNMLWTNTIHNKKKSDHLMEFDTFRILDPGGEKIEKMAPIPRSEKAMDTLHEGECQTDNHTADVHVIRNDDIMNGVSERSEVFEYVPGVPGQS